MNIFEAIKEISKKYLEDEIKSDCIDFYIEGYDTYFPTFVIPDEPFETIISNYFLKKFETVLNYEVSSIEYPFWTKVFIKDDDKEDLEIMEKNIRRFLYDNAGYCPYTEYKKLFKEEEYAEGDIFDEFDICLKYGILLDVDLLGQYYSIWKDLYDKNVSKEEFMKKYNELTNDIED